MSKTIVRIMAKAALTTYRKGAWDMASHSGREQAIEEQQAALDALDQAGFKVVPKEPGDE